MKDIKKILLVAVAVMAMTMPASAQLRFGVKAGVTFNSLHYTEIDYVKDNTRSFTAGVMVDYTLPLIGIGVDASLMYNHRRIPYSNYLTTDSKGNPIFGSHTSGKDFLEIPVNLKYSFNMPVIERVVKPYLTTGPSFAFQLSEPETSDKYKFIKTNKTSVSWNIGGGVELLRNIQVGLNYRLGLSTINKEKLDYTQHIDIKPFDIKSNAWTVTVGYLF